MNRIIPLLILSLLLLPSFGWASNLDQEVIIYVSDWGDNWQDESQSPTEIALSGELDNGRVYVAKQLSPENKWYHLMLSESQVEAITHLEFQGKTSRISLPETGEPVFVGISHSENFPEGVKILTEADMEALHSSEEGRTEGEFPVIKEVPEQLQAQANLLRQIMDWPKSNRFESDSERENEWQPARFGEKATETFSMQEVIIYVRDWGDNWHHHSWQDGKKVRAEIALAADLEEERVYFSEEVSSEEQWYHLFVPKAQLAAVTQLEFQGKISHISLEEADGPIYVGIYHSQLFPDGLQVFTEADIQALISPEKVRVDGEMAILEEVPGQLQSQANLLLPIMDWPGSTNRYQTDLEVENDWQTARFELSFPAVFPTLVFIEYMGRYYPLLTEEGDHYEMNWDLADEEAKALSVSRGDNWHRHRVDAQDFFSHRYPNGLSETAYLQLVHAFSGNLAQRADTLIAWSRAIVPFFEESHSDSDHFLALLNQVGRHTDQDLFERGYEHYWDQKQESTWSSFRGWTDLLLVGLILSMILFGGAVVLRLANSRLMPEKTWNWVEGIFYAFASVNFLFQALIYYNHGILEVSRVSAWIFCFVPITFFYFNMRFLVAELLMKKMWGRYLLAVSGASVLFFVLAGMASLLPFTDYGLWSLDGEWHWMKDAGNFGPGNHPDAIIAIQLFMLVITPIYGAGRYLLLKRVPKLHRQKEALNVELKHLKSQISPHFFFNSLNTVYGFALSEESPKTAEAITKLSSLMRFAMYQGDQPTIPLETELDYLADYVELQRLRLNPLRHDLSFSIEGEIGDLKIAPLLLITLVENAFKHGISMSRDSYIRIDLFVQERGLILTVENSVHPNKPVPVAAGVAPEGGLGLVNTRQRLDLLYRGEYDWQIEETTDYYRTQLSLNLDA